MADRTPPAKRADGDEPVVVDNLVEMMERDLAAAEELAKSRGERIEELERAASEHDGGLVRALARAQAAFPPIPKTKTATVATKGGGEYRYSYADLADVLAAVRPVLAAEGLAITQHTVPAVPARDGAPPAPPMLVTELRHVGGSTFSTEVELAQSPGNPQQYGGALTYLRRYELVTLLGIHADEDTDGQHVAPTNGAPAREEEAPAWAAHASKMRLATLIDYLEPLLGREAARELVRDVKGNLGVVPDVLVTFTGAVNARMTAAAQDEDAERPDPPARDGLAERAHASTERAIDSLLAEGKITAEEAAVMRGNDEAADAAIAAAADLVHGYADEPPPDVGEGDLGPPAGTIEPGQLPQDPAKAIGALRALGCTCDNPLAEPYDDACPIAGHGIPF